MNRHRIVFFPLCILFFIFLSCHKDNPVEPVQTVTPAFSGTVTDSSGAVVEGAGVYFITHFDKPLPVSGPRKTTPTTQIRYDIDTTGFVTVVLFRYGTNELIDTLADDSVTAGSYAITIDQVSLTNGLYYYTIYLNHKFYAKHYMMNYIDQALELVDTDPLILTDANGKFTLPIKVFGAGFKLFVTGGTSDVIDTLTITNTIDLVLYESGYQVFTKQITFDTTKSYSGKFVLIEGLTKRR